MVHWSTLSADSASCLFCLLWAKDCVLTASYLLLWFLFCLEAWILSRVGDRCCGNNLHSCVWHLLPMCSPCPVYQIGFSIFFSILQQFCSVTLGVPSQLRLTLGDWHSRAHLYLLPALWLGRTAGTNNYYFHLQEFLLNYLLLDFYNYFTSPVPIRPTYWHPWPIFILANACLHWSWACNSLPICETHVFCSACILSIVFCATQAADCVAIGGRGIFLVRHLAVARVNAFMCLNIVSIACLLDAAINLSYALCCLGGGWT